ncbi:cytochrome c oxidase, subunit VA/VI [Gorgonomyces haynaldii]|nr:cytochrome c oxidase, subunit VA/VI [Gorgonomyces haynaldii]
MFGRALRLRSVRSLNLRTATRFYSSELDPANKSEYDQYVDHWKHHFATVDEDFELERGLNHIFAADWVPSVEVVEEALKASRRLNTFATAVRILEGLEEKAPKKDQYEQYIRHLSPLLKDLGVPEKKELGEFAIFRDRNPWLE